MFPAAHRILCVLVVLWVAVAPSPAEVVREVFGETAEGQQVEIFTLTNPAGLRARVTTWGATLVEMSVPDRAGKLADVVLGFDTLAPYLGPHPVFGAIVGRFANRIARGKFTLDGKTYELATNAGPHHIHGGTRGFDKRIWKAEAVPPASVRFSYISPDGEEGYPGALTAQVTYTLSEASELRIEYEATTDAPTVVNFTNHAYWNLASAGDVLDHELRVNADRVTANDRDLIPTGELRDVMGTAADFRTAKLIGRDIAAPELAATRGYDHNFVLNHALGAPEAAKPILAAELFAPKTGRVMEVWTDQPGIQLYTANGMRNIAGKAARTYGNHAGVCLETQHFPDSPNHPSFPSTVLRPGETFRSTTLHRFSAK